MQTEIAYDKQQRCHQLIASNGAKLGSYRKHRQAVEAQLALEAPQTLELARRAAERYPVLAGRALQAAQLVAAGKVHLDGSCHRVESQNGAGEYRVDQMDSTWRCSRPDWQASIAGEPFAAPVVGRGPKCKHILAVLMAIKCEEEIIPSSPAPPSAPLLDLCGINSRPSPASRNTSARWTKKAPPPACYLLSP